MDTISSNVGSRVYMTDIISVNKIPSIRNDAPDLNVSEIRGC